jgi:hypothetical protein
METKTIGIASLMLDAQNPRHGVVQSQNEAIQAIITEQEGKLVTLARDIAEHGLSPLDRMLVIKAGRNYTVVEGNRRIAAVKLLHNPDLAEGTPLERAIKDIAAKASSRPDQIDCAIAPSRDAARHWMVLRHTGEQDGAGVVPWNAPASHRFFARPGSQVAKALAFLDDVKTTYPNNPAIQEAVATIEATRITTLGRLVADPTFRDHLGLQDDNGKLIALHPAAVLEPVLEQILNDVATHLTVTQIKTKDLRTKYLATIPKPKPGVTAQPSTASTTTTTTPTPTPAPKPTKPGSPFKEINLSRLGQRIQDIVTELRKLDITKTPNAAAILTRVVLEFSVDEYIAKKGLATDGKLKKRVGRVLHHVDPTSTDPKYQGVRAGLADGTSMLSVATLHGYVHNPNFHPTPTDVRNIVGNLKPFFQAMNDGV